MFHAVHWFPRWYLIERVPISMLLTLSTDWHCHCVESLVELVSWLCCWDVNSPACAYGLVWKSESSDPVDAILRAVSWSVMSSISSTFSSSDAVSGAEKRVGRSHEQCWYCKAARRFLGMACRDDRGAWVAINHRVSPSHIALAGSLDAVGSVPFALQFQQRG